MAAVSLPRLAARKGKETFIAGCQAEPTTLAPCSLACPLGINVQRYVGLAQRGLLVEALDTIVQACPLPGVCGYLCQRPCESACRRGDADRSVAVRWLKRAAVGAGLRVSGTSLPMDVARRSPWRIGIIGAGPSGLSAAAILARRGHAVTLIDERPRPGGLLSDMVPDFRLPRRVLQADVDRILALDGVETRFGHRVTCDDQGRPPLEGQAQGKQEFAAWLWASGAGRRRPSSWPDAEGIVTAWSVLAGDDDQWPVAGPVFVLGATATAVAAARRLARLGQQQVVLVSGYPGTRWPVDAEDLAAAVDEGVSLRDRWNLDEAVVEGGRLVAVAGRATRTAAGRAPRPEGVVQHLPATRLVVLEQREAELPQELSSSSSSVADGLAYQTSLPGIFAAGEAVTGPKTVVEAIAAGKGAALSIDGFLWGRQPPQPERRRSWAELVQVGRPWQPGGAPQAAPGQVEIAAAEAVTEARRCLRCGPCADCDHCDPACPHERVLGVDAEGPIVYRAPAGCAAATDVLAARVDEALCTGCGRCEGSCPHHAVVVAFRLGGMVLAQVDRPACRGCGRCVASCPFGAIELNQGLWDREQLWRQIAEQRRAR